MIDSSATTVMDVLALLLFTTSIIIFCWPYSPGLGFLVGGAFLGASSYAIAYRQRPQGTDNRT